MKVIRVLHVIGAGEFGGAERHILNLVAAMNPEKVRVTVCCLFAEPFVKVAKEKGLDALAIPMRHKRDMGIIKQLKALMLQEKVDIVHTHGVRANLVGRLAAKQAGKKIVVTTEHSLLAQDYPGFLSRMLNMLIEKFSRPITTHFIAVSDGLRRALLKQGISENKITVIHNGLNPEDFVTHQPLDFWRQKLHIEASVPVVGIVGRLHPVKGHRYFLQAAQQILQTKPEVRFLVVGDGSERPSLEAYAAELGITDQVIFTGFVKEVAEIMPALNVLVIPSLWEGFGLTALEGMVLKVPVLASSIGGLPEVVEDEYTGLLVPPADSQALAEKTLWMLDNPEETRILSQNALKVLQEKFTSQVMAAKTEQLYAWLLAKSREKI
ncbi:MAG: glycosyltransferase [Clostridia bacterium]|nr:glycosyltransferase [Clostridia bacterium]